MRCQQIENKGTWIIFDKELVGPECVRLFDKDWLRSVGGAVEPERGKALMFDYQGIPLVFKHYQRGGLLGRLVKRAYLFAGLEKTRMWREFALLQRMRDAGLPVPRPVAVRCVRLSPATYTGELITVRIADSHTLAERLCESPLPGETWSRVGEVIARFHGQHVYHADLNANNILLNSAGELFLIDFDKSEMRSRLSRKEAQANILRLQRSLLKLQGRSPVFHYSAQDWQALLDGYSAGGAR